MVFLAMSATGLVDKSAIGSKSLSTSYRTEVVTLLMTKLVWSPMPMV